MFPGEVLSEGQVEQLQQAAGEVLSTTGFRVMDDAALAACRKAGAHADMASGVVRFPAGLLRELLAMAPGGYTVGGIDGKRWEIGAGAPWGVAIVTDPWIIDYGTRQPRKPLLEDICRHTAIAQAMEDVAAIARMDYPVADVEGPESSLRAWEAHLLRHTKHYYYVPAEAESNRQWRRILEILLAGRGADAPPLFSTMVAVISPLTVSALNVDLMRLSIGCGAPVVPTICPMAGSTSPYTPAATLLQGHCENLAMAALLQVMKPGHPFLYAFGPSVMDMNSGHDRYYTLDKALWKPAAVQLAKACGLPASAECGGTMTYRYDPQNGAEGMLFMLSALASGADVLAGFGSSYGAMGMSAEMMMLHEAWLRVCRFLLQGISTEDRDMGIGSLDMAGPGGNFLTDALTLQNMHGGAFFRDPLFDEAFCGGHDRGMLERAHERARDMAGDCGPVVPDAVREQLERFFNDECAKLGAK